MKNTVDPLFDEEEFLDNAKDAYSVVRPDCLLIVYPYGLTVCS
jgi:hypothetical protein